MDAEISCEAFVRMSHVTDSMITKDQEKFKANFRSLYVERKNNNLFFVTTNRRIAAIVYGGKNDGIDCNFNIEFSEALLQQCKTEIQFDGKITINFNEMLNFLTLKTSFGFMSNDVLNANETTEFNKWREWFPDEIPTANHGVMLMNSEFVANLGRSSPSGFFSFPEFIDNRKPVVVNDLHDENWTGLFMADNTAEKIEPARMHEWLTL